LAKIYEKCGSTKNVIRHHPDYSKPNKIVLWCRRCHNLFHNKQKNKSFVTLGIREYPEAIQIVNELAQIENRTATKALETLVLMIGPPKIKSLKAKLEQK